MVNLVLSVMLAVSAAGQSPQSPADWSPMLDGTAANFEKLTLDSAVPVFVLFYVRDGCKPCVAHHEILKKVMPDYSGRVVFIRVEASKESAIAVAASIRAVPTSFVLKNRENAGAVAEGFMDEAHLRKFIDDALALPPRKSAGAGKETIRRVSDRTGAIGWPALSAEPPEGKREVVPFRPRS